MSCDSTNLVQTLKNKYLDSSQGYFINIVPEDTENQMQYYAVAFSNPAFKNSGKTTSLHKDVVPPAADKYNMYVIAEGAKKDDGALFKRGFGKYLKGDVKNIAVSKDTQLSYATVDPADFENIIGDVYNSLYTHQQGGGNVTVTKPFPDSLSTPKNKPDYSQLTVCTYKYQDLAEHSKKQKLLGQSPPPFQPIEPPRNQLWMYALLALFLLLVIASTIYFLS